MANDHSKRERSQFINQIPRHSFANDKDNKKKRKEGVSAATTFIIMQLLSEPRGGRAQREGGGKQTSAGSGKALREVGGRKREDVPETEERRESP